MPGVLMMLRVFADVECSLLMPDVFVDIGGYC